MTPRAATPADRPTTWLDVLSDGWGPETVGPGYWDALGRLVDTLPTLPPDAEFELPEFP